MAAERHLLGLGLVCDIRLIAGGWLQLSGAFDGMRNGCSLWRWLARWPVPGISGVVLGVGQSRGVTGTRSWSFGERLELASCIRRCCRGWW